MKVRCQEDTHKKKTQDLKKLVGRFRNVREDMREEGGSVRRACVRVYEFVCAGVRACATLMMDPVHSGTSIGGSCSKIASRRSSIDLNGPK